MKYPTTRFVFDRKKTATKKLRSLVQVEIQLSGKKKYVTTGVKVTKDCWSDRDLIVRCDDADTLNVRIKGIKSSIDSYIASLAESAKEWDWDAFSRFLVTSSDKSMSFIDYVDKRINERTDIRDSSRKSQRKIVESLREYGKIVKFDELTRSNIAEYYEWLLGRKIKKIGADGLPYSTTMSASTAWGYMKTLKTYIHDAIVHELIDRDPSVGVKVKREELKNVRWLTIDEIHQIESAELSSGSLVRARDLFIFMCYTGLAYSDAVEFSADKIETEGEYTFVTGRRKKTNGEYFVLLLPEAKTILEKYKYKLPKISNQQFNMKLKTIAEESGIDKPLTSHFARHSCAMMLLNKGVRMETVAKILGHANTRVTESTYASILKKTVGDEMKLLIKE